jgi:hypothetical protein
MDVIVYIVMEFWIRVVAPGRSGSTPPAAVLPRLAARWGTPAFDPDGFLVLRHSSWTRGIIVTVVLGAA